MAKDVPASERVIDREAELELFAKVLASASAPCLITVQEGAGQGKSWLLQRLVEHAIDVEPRAATVLATLQVGGQLWSLVETIHLELASSGAPLTRFENLNVARLTSDHDAFGLPAPPTPRVDVAVVGSELQNSPIIGAEIPVWPQGWPDGHEQAARQRCLAALLDDLQDLSRQRPVVVLLDQYERSTPEIEQWLMRALLTRVFDEGDPFGQLVLVVASTDPVFPTLANRLRARAADRLHQITELSRWRDSHIDEWMARAEIPNPDVWKLVVREMLNSGRSLLDLKILAGLAKRRT